MAFGITLRNKVAYVGTWEDGGTIYGFDYSVAAHPRMVAIMPEGGQICDSVLTLVNDGTDLFDGGQLEGFPFLDIDLSQPNNVINFYPIFASAITPVQSHPCTDALTAAQSDGSPTTYALQRDHLRRRQR
jgi:hypothetical protein